MVLGVLGGMGVGVRWLGDGWERSEKIGGSAVMRESAGNARLMGQMLYAICFSF